MFFSCLSFHGFIVSSSSQRMRRIVQPRWRCSSAPHGNQSQPRGYQWSDGWTTWLPLCAAREYLSILGARWWMCYNNLWNSLCVLCLMFLFLSGRKDSNFRPLGPKPSALPTAPLPDAGTALDSPVATSPSWVAGEKNKPPVDLGNFGNPAYTPYSYISDTPLNSSIPPQSLEVLNFDGLFFCDRDRIRTCNCLHRPV